MHLATFTNAARVLPPSRLNIDPPLCQLSFMPTWLANGTSTVCHYKGNNNPPNNYTQVSHKRYVAEHIPLGWPRQRMTYWNNLPGLAVWHGEVCLQGDADWRFVVL